ncbi:site-specific integrase [Lacticaseibacillus saniviri]
MASFKKKPSGWMVRVSYYDSEGNRKFKNRQGFATKKEAQYWAAKNEVKKLDGDTLVESTEPLSEYFKNWYLRYKQPNIAPATQKWYENTLTIINDNFGETPISAITHDAYQDFLTRLGRTHVKSTVSKINGHIREAVGYAIDAHLLHDDFTRRAVITGVISGRPSDLKYLNAAETERLAHLAESDASLKSVSKYMIVTALYTGARLAEIAGLTWDDINFTFGSIRINKTYDYQNVGEFKDTKNEQSHRVIKVNDELLILLKRLRDQQDMAFPRLFIKNPHKFVFLNSQNSVPTSAAVNKTLRTLLSKIDVRPEIANLNFHGLRHTHASFLLYKGISIYYISKRLGHQSIAITLKTYSHILNELEKEESDKALSALTSLGVHQKDRVHHEKMG